MVRAKKKKSKSKTWTKTGIGATIRMETTIIEGRPCARLATMKANSVRVSLYYEYSGEQFMTVISTVTNQVFIEVLPDVEHAQLVYNRLPRRVHPDRLGSIGIVNPLEADVGDLEDDLIAEFGRAV